VAHLSTSGLLGRVPQSLTIFQKIFEKFPQEDSSGEQEKKKRQHSKGPKVGAKENEFTTRTAESLVINYHFDWWKPC